MKKSLLLLCMLAMLLVTGYGQVPKKLPVPKDSIKLEPAVPPIKIDCSCDNNIIQDGGFRTCRTSPNSTDLDNNSPIWKPLTHTPQWDRGAGCCDSGFIKMWGNSTVGESIEQRGINIVAGRTYRISFCAKFFNQNGSNNPLVRFRFRVYNSSIPATLSYTAGLRIDPLINITNTNWSSYSFSWTASGNYNSIAINPENDNTQNHSNYVSWGGIDNVCIQEIRCNCGQWGSITFRNNNDKKQLKCKETIVVKQGQAWVINPSFACAGGCTAKLTGTLTTPTGQTQIINSFPFVFTASQLCTYKLNIQATCGDKSCGTCSINIFSTPGCPGEVIDKVAQLQDYIEINYPLVDYSPDSPQVQGKQIIFCEGGHQVLYNWSHGEITYVKTGTNTCNGGPAWDGGIVCTSPCGVGYLVPTETDITDESFTNQKEILTRQQLINLFKTYIPNNYEVSRCYIARSGNDLRLIIDCRNKNTRQNILIINPLREEKGYLKIKDHPFVLSVVNDTVQKQNKETVAGNKNFNVAHISLLK